MRKQYTYKPVALRFRRWSRKRYAAFISIQHAVTIGQLSANVSERFQAKNGSVHTSVLTFDKVNDGETEEKENTSHPDCSKDITLSLLLQALCPVQIANRPAASYADLHQVFYKSKDILLKKINTIFLKSGKINYHIIKDNISEIAEGLSYKLKAFRDFRLYKYPNT